MNFKEALKIVLNEAEVSAIGNRDDTQLETLSACQVVKQFLKYLPNSFKNDDTPNKQKEFSQRFYEQLFEGKFIAGGRVLAGAGDLYRLKTLANCFVSQIDSDYIDSIY